MPPGFTLRRTAVAALLSGATDFASSLQHPSAWGLRSARRSFARRATYDVTLDLPDGESVTFPCADDEFIIDAAEEHGFELPASCRSGASCRRRRFFRGGPSARIEFRLAALRT